MVAVRHYTPAEAAALSGVGIKAVHNAIDKHIIESPARMADGRERRRLSAADVLRLKLWNEVGAILSPERRQRLFAEIEQRPTAECVKADTLVIVDVGEARRQIARRVKDLEAAEAAIARSAAVMGGEPVFKGTRIPVRMIAAMLEDGVDAADILAGYPKLEAPQLDLARLWTAAHPRRGRPKSLAEHGLSVRSQLRIPLKIDAGRNTTRNPGRA